MYFIVIRLLFLIVRVNYYKYAPFIRKKSVVNRTKLKKTNLLIYGRLTRDNCKMDELLAKVVSFFYKFPQIFTRLCVN